MISVENLKMNIGFNDYDIINVCAKKLNIKPKEILKYEIIRQSIDARRKPNVFYSLHVAVELSPSLEKRFEKLKVNIDHGILKFDRKRLKSKPIVVGFGPSGMFCALMLARMGLNPIVVEQGEAVDKREKTVNDFWNNRVLNEYSNVQFGEGGAGTFSDGKLNTNLSSKECKQILNEFVYFGAPNEILYISKPHIGSDNLKKIVKNIREEIISLGGKVLFSTRMKEILCDNEKVTGIELENVETGESFQLNTEHLILALGHSARKSFKHLKDINIELKQKPFAMGVRIEQKQEDINNIQYGKGYDKRLPSADYKLVAHLPNGRSVFTFCMCPGGYVVASSSNSGEIVTNGMSNFARDNEFANSALLVNVMPEDFGSDDVLAGIYMQEKYEKLAFECGGANYNAPCETIDSFVNNKAIDIKSSSYKPGLTPCKLEKCLPKFVCDALKHGIVELNKKIMDFAKHDNLLIGIESRSSCPLTIVRNEEFQANIKGIYPIGEGAGYAGGIVSSALDGIKVAKSIYEKL